MPISCPFFSCSLAKHNISIAFESGQTLVMYWWCFFHNQMCAIHHRNWHLWHYNRFLLINWYTMRPVGLNARYFQTNHRCSVSDPMLKLPTDAIFLWPRSGNLRSLHFEKAKIKNKCFAQDALVYILEWNARAMKYALDVCAQFAMCCIIKRNTKRKTDVYMLWLIYFWFCAHEWTAALPHQKRKVKKRETHTERERARAKYTNSEKVKEKDCSRYF